MQWYLTVVRDNYANFTGRASRKEYWMFVLFNVILDVIAIILDNMLGTTFKLGEGYYATSLPYGWIYLLYSLGVFIPGLAVFVRRLHDTGKSGWMLLLLFIPIVGAIWLLVDVCTDGNPGDNIYGPSPKVTKQPSTEGKITTATPNQGQRKSEEKPSTLSHTASKLGILFDIDELGGGLYGYAAYKILF